MQSGSRADSLHKWLERRDLTMEELVEAADALVVDLAPRQTKYKVTERPDARTIRYYVTQSLLPKPLGYDGGRARYGGTHLLRLLWIKKLQAEHHTLTQISKQFLGKTDAELLAALDAILALDPEPRVAHAPGRGMELTAEMLSDPKKREELAESLEALAAWLRNPGGKA